MHTSILVFSDLPGTKQKKNTEKILFASLSSPRLRENIFPYYFLTTMYKVYGGLWALWPYMWYLMVANRLMAMGTLWTDLQPLNTKYTVTNWCHYYYTMVNKMYILFALKFIASVFSTFDTPGTAVCDVTDCLTYRAIALCNIAQPLSWIITRNCSHIRTKLKHVSIFVAKYRLKQNSSQTTQSFRFCNLLMQKEMSHWPSKYKPNLLSLHSLITVNNSAVLLHSINTQVSYSLAWICIHGASILTFARLLWPWPCR